MQQWMLVVLIVIIGAELSAQSQYFPRDTTYSISSAYRKIKKKYPFVQVIDTTLPEEVEVHKNLVYLDLENGRQLHLDLLRPRQEHVADLPLVILIHGGGWMAGAKENLLPLAAQLSLNGYLCATVEYRLGGEAPYPSAVYDLKAALRWLRSQSQKYGIDQNQIILLGCSAGAQLATLLGTTHQQPIFEKDTNDAEQAVKVKAIINVDGIVSFIHPEAAPEWSGKSANAWLGDYQQHYDRWKQASPLEYADANTPPILFINSGFSRFHAGRDDLIAILESHQTYSELHTFDDAPHSFWHVQPWFQPTVELILTFLKKMIRL
ncbi:MAG: alpha/beta hydrolase [Saprospiraceae bacterium]|nr:alpha/beta hydrolase [Saprospiraceae bacterium]